jgi:hypothetical protein
MTIISTRFTRHVTVAALLVGTLSAAPVLAGDGPSIAFLSNEVPVNGTATATFSSWSGLYWVAFWMTTDGPLVVNSLKPEAALTSNEKVFPWSSFNNGIDCDRDFIFLIYNTDPNLPSWDMNNFIAMSNEITFKGLDPTNPSCVGGDGGGGDGGGGDGGGCNGCGDGGGGDGGDGGGGDGGGGDGGDGGGGDGGGFGFGFELRHYLQRPGALPDTL